MSFSTTLSYATDDGSITSSYIIALLMADVNYGKITSLLVDEQSIDIISDKPLSLMCLSDTGVMIVLFFVGFLVAAIISGIIITILAYIIAILV